jgi:(2S)-methylsuccinyl-CoA dehydrogenase
MNESHHSNLELTKDFLRVLRSQFEMCVQSLSDRCLLKGKVDAERFDAHQITSFEIAWACADLLAADEATLVLSSASSERDIRLALVFSVDAIVTVLARLELLCVDFCIDTVEIQKLIIDPRWARLRHDVIGAAALEAAGRLLVSDTSEIGPVSMSEQLAMAQAAFRRFASEVVAPQAEAIHRHDLTVPEPLLQSMRDIGVFGLSIPEEFGGSASNAHDDALMMVVVTEALSEASLAAAGSLITRPEILSRALLEGGTASQKNYWLPKIAAGNPLCAISISEPDFGSDVASLNLRGMPVQLAGKTGWLLNGAKTWCTFAGKAGLLMVVTRTQPERGLGHKGLSLLLIEKPSFDGHAFDFVQPNGGRLTGKAIPTIGYRGMHSFDLSFENFFVPDANVIGEESGLGKGFYYTMAGMMGGRLQTAARASGVMRAALRAAQRYAADRKVFGAPLLDYPLTLGKIARMAARYAACRQLTYAVGRMFDEGGGRMESSLIKLLACRSAEMVTRESLQIHGGMGYAEEMPISRYFVDARVLSIFEGAEETLALKVIARALVENAIAQEALAA